MAEEKILNEEVMSQEELENVAGGTYNQTAADSRFLHDLNGSTDGYSAGSAFFIHSKISREVTAAWSKLGISVDTSWGCPDNKYYLDGKEITRREAINYACKKYNTTLNDMKGDYNY